MSVLFNEYGVAAITFGSLLQSARLLLFFIAVTLVVKLLMENRKRKQIDPRLKNLPLPPGPSGLPVLGFLPFLGRDFHLTLTKLSKQYGPIYQIFLGGKRIVVVNDPKIVREAFRQPVFSGRPDTELTKILQGYGISNSEGALWREQRAFLHSVFRRFGAKSMMQGKNGLEHKIQVQVQEFLSELSSNYEGRPFRMRPILARAVSNVVGSLLMSMTFKSHNDKNFSRLLELMEEGFKLVSLAMPVNFVPILRYIPTLNWAYEKIKMNRQETGAYFKRITDEHRKTLDVDNARDFVDAYLIQKEKMDQLSHRELHPTDKYTESHLHYASNRGSSISSYNQNPNDAGIQQVQSYFSEAQLIQIMNDIFSAGLETVTSTLEWAVLFLMNNPEVQTLIQEELDRVVGSNRLPELDDLSRMPYTEATIYETLRRANVVVLGNAHATLADAELAGFFIPERTHVLSNLYAVHMDPDLWEEPEKFKPERFIKDGKVFKPDHFIPFSVGRRMCPGDILTKMEVFLFLTGLLNEYNIRVPDGCKMPDEEGNVGASMSAKPFDVLLVPRFAKHSHVDGSFKLQDKFCAETPSQRVQEELNDCTKQR